MKALINLMRGPAPEKVEVEEAADANYKLAPLKVPLPGPGLLEEPSDTSGQLVVYGQEKNEDGAVPKEGQPSSPASSGTEHTSAETSSGDEDGLVWIGPDSGDGKQSEKVSQALVVQSDVAAQQQAVLEEKPRPESTEEPPAVSQVRNIFFGSLTL